MDEKKPTCWDCNRAGQAVTMTKREVVCRFYGELKVLGSVTDPLPVPEWCPKRGQEKKGEK